MEHHRRMRSTPTALRLSIDQLVGPLVLGNAARVHPTLVIFCFLAGGALFGIVGVILAVPVALTVKVTLATIYARAGRAVMSRLCGIDALQQIEADLKLSLHLARYLGGWRRCNSGRGMTLETSVQRSFARVVFAFDSRLRRRNGVFDYIDSPDCILRVKLERAGRSDRFARTASVWSRRSNHRTPLPERVFSLDGRRRARRSLGRDA